MERSDSIYANALDKYLIKIDLSKITATKIGLGDIFYDSTGLPIGIALSSNNKEGYILVKVIKESSISSQ